MKANRVLLASRRLYQGLNWLRKKLFQLLYSRTVLVLAILLIFGVVGALWNMSRLSSNLIASQATENAALYAQMVKEARTLYSSEVVSRVKGVPGVDVTHNYAHQVGAIPLPATYLLEFGRRISEQNPGMSVRLYSDYPFPWREAEGGPRDRFEREALHYLKRNPERTFTRFEQFQGLPALRYAQADVMKPSCVGCHNSHPDTPKNDWEVGDVRGILEVTTPLEAFVKETNSGLQGMSVMLAGLSILGLSGITLVIGRLRRTSEELEHRVVRRTADLQSANTQLATANSQLAMANDQLAAVNNQLEVEQEKSNQLLLNILPESVAVELKEGRNNIAEAFSAVTVLFADIVEFTRLSEKIPPDEMVELLNDIFSRFDRLTEDYQLEKIKTIGDAYMVAGGLPTHRDDHVEAVAKMALSIKDEIEEFNQKRHKAFKIRIGMNTGPVVAGVIGTSKFIYDLWGDTVNIASRMESQGIAGEIQVTQAIYDCLQEEYEFEARGSIPVKGKGEMQAYLLKGRRT